jgi:predicted secreted protein
MTTNAITAMGTVLTFNSNTIGEIQTLAGTRNRRIIDILSCDSTDQAVEKIAGALNEGEVTFHCIYDGSDAGVYNDLNTDFQANAKATCLITLPDTSSFSCTGIISSLSLPSFSEADGEYSLDVTIAFSGKATYIDVAA